jgi:hypothetical protein
MMDEEIRQALSEVREMKQMCGNINMKLTNIVTQRGQDWKKKLEAEYQRGLDDAWEAARKVVCDESFDWNTILHIFNRSSFESIFGDLSASEAIAKLKAYEEKQKADDEIKIGDEVETKDGKRFVVTTFGSGFDGDIAVGVCADGLGLGVDLKELRKTGRHFDISSILKEMQS